MVKKSRAKKARLAKKIKQNLEKYNLAPQSDAPFYTVHDFSSPINGNDFARDWKHKKLRIKD